MSWPVTFCLLCYNEERNLERYFGHVRPLTREIVVVDSGSTDGSVATALRHADIVVSNPLEDFSAQRNLAASKATNRWVMHLDADEVLTPELIRALGELFDSGRVHEHAAYCFPRKTFDEEGRFRKIVQSYPGFHYRLYDRERCRWVKPVHETLQVDGPKKFIPHHMLHYPDYSRVPAKVVLYDGLKKQKTDDHNRSTVATMTENLLFHARALFIDLDMWKSPRDFIYACRWLGHHAHIRVRRRLETGRATATRL
ncbi:MAG: glycosyltransferase family 2 protein [Acidobacteriota bacterium]